MSGPATAIMTGDTGDCADMLGCGVHALLAGMAQGGWGKFEVEAIGGWSCRGSGFGYRADRITGGGRSLLLLPTLGLR